MIMACNSIRDQLTINNKTARTYWTTVHRITKLCLIHKLLLLLSNLFEDCSQTDRNSESYSINLKLNFHILKAPTILILIVSFILLVYFLKIQSHRFEKLPDPSQQVISQQNTSHYPCMAQPPLLTYIFHLRYVQMLLVLLDGAGSEF